MEVLDKYCDEGVVSIMMHEYLTPEKRWDIDWNCVTSLITAGINPDFIRCTINDLPEVAHITLFGYVLKCSRDDELISRINFLIEHKADVNKHPYAGLKGVSDVPTGALLHQLSK